MKYSHILLLLQNFMLNVTLALFIISKTFSLFYEFSCCSVTQNVYTILVIFCNKRFSLIRIPYFIIHFQYSMFSFSFIIPTYSEASVSKIDIMGQFLLVLFSQIVNLSYVKPCMASFKESCLKFLRRTINLEGTFI